MVIQPNDDARHQEQVRNEVNATQAHTKEKFDDVRTKSRVQQNLTNQPPPVSPHPERAMNHIPEKDYPSGPFPE